jgi:hypothetical protein
MTSSKTPSSYAASLVKDAEVPAANMEMDSFAVLLLATMSGTWNIGFSEWIPRTTCRRVVCPGPYFCGFTRDMKRGDYLEIKGELYVYDYERPVVVEGEACRSESQSTHPIRRVQKRLRGDPRGFARRCSLPSG